MKKLLTSIAMIATVVSFNAQALEPKLTDQDPQQENCIGPDLYFYVWTKCVGIKQYVDPICLLPFCQAPIEK